MSMPQKRPSRLNSSSLLKEQRVALKSISLAISDPRRCPFKSPPKNGPRGSANHHGREEGRQELWSDLAADLVHLLRITIANNLPVVIIIFDIGNAGIIGLIPNTGTGLFQVVSDHVRHIQALPWQSSSWKTVRIPCSVCPFK